MPTASLIPEEGESLNVEKMLHFFETLLAGISGRKRRGESRKKKSYIGGGKREGKGSITERRRRSGAEKGFVIPSTSVAKGRMCPKKKAPPTFICRGAF